MDIHSTAFLGKRQILNSKSIRKVADGSQKATKEPPNSRQKRVFGTSKSTNILIKNSTDKQPLRKSSIAVAQKQSKVSTNVARKTNPTTAETSEKIFHRKEKSISGNKSVSFQKQENILQEDQNATIENFSPRTPVVSPASKKGNKIFGTPYYTAENCSKCRLDRLETASYWLGQIKLAESVGKHFVSAAFFALAFESKAEPIRKLRSELREYLGRHECLSSQIEWRNACMIYKLLKDIDSESGKIPDNEEACKCKPIASDTHQDQNVSEEKHSETR